jgi:signal transduction histidine kinase
MNVNVFVDEHMIVAVIRNLISNGIKYTPENGMVKINVELNGNSVKISITDTGVGMPQSTIDSLFKIEKTNSTKGTSGETGTGLGLIISNDFLLKHGSKLEVQSKINIGTTFSFSLPRSA